MLVEHIREFLQSNDRKVLDPEYTELYQEAVFHALKRQFFDAQEDRRTLRVSSLGKCLRMQAYSVLGYDKCTTPSPRLKMLFHFGDIIEANLIVLLQHAGVEVRDQQLEIECEGVKGHIDGSVALDNNYLLEIKSMSDYSFKKFKSKGMVDDGFGYVTQANTYAVEGGYDGIIWLAQNKNNSEIHDEVMDIDLELYDRTKDNIATLKACKDPSIFLQYEVEQELWYRKPTGNYILPFQCSTCDFVHHCRGGCTKYERKGKIKHYSGDIVHGDWTKGGKVI